MENSELISGSDMVRAAEAMHNEGRKRGWFQQDWSTLPKESKERYEVLALAALATRTPAQRVTVEEVAAILHPVLRGDYAVGGEAEAKLSAQALKAKHPQLFKE